MRDIFGSAWAYYFAITFLIVWALAYRALRK
jgi:hypothetical protein